MGVTATAAVGLAAALDAAVAEPPERVHPVALFGRLVAPVDRPWERPRLVGWLAAVVLPLVAAAAAGGTTALAGRLAAGATATDVAVAIVAGGWLFATTSRRLLLSAAREVVAASAEDPAAAREALPALAGRDAAPLSPGELRSAAVESAAENLADGLVAPLLAFALLTQFSVAAGAAAAAWVKAVNTLDSMLGYRSKPVGAAAARLDDVVMWLPARASAVLLAVAGRSPRALLRARRWAGEPSSPNSGWPMATLAALLDVRLAKPGAYVLNEGAALPTTAEARRGVRLVGGAGALAILAAGVVAWP